MKETKIRVIVSEYIPILSAVTRPCPDGGGENTGPTHVRTVVAPEVAKSKYSKVLLQSINTMLFDPLQMS